MSLRSQLALATLSILATAALAATAADARPGQGRGHSPQSTTAVVQATPQVEAPAATGDSSEVTIETTDSVVVEIPETEISGVSAPTEYENLPPGLQRQVDRDRGLPPGLQRQADSDRGLPAGLQRSR